MGFIYCKHQSLAHFLGSRTLLWLGHNGLVIIALPRNTNVMMVCLGMDALVMAIT